MHNASTVHQAADDNVRYYAADDGDGDDDEDDDVVLHPLVARPMMHATER